MSRTPSSRMYLLNAVPSLCPTKYTTSTSVTLKHPCATMRTATLMMESYGRSARARAILWFHAH